MVVARNAIIVGCCNVVEQESTFEVVSLINFCRAEKYFGRPPD